MQQVYMKMDQISLMQMLHLNRNKAVSDFYNVALAFEGLKSIYAKTSPYMINARNSIGKISSKVISKGKARASTVNNSSSLANKGTLKTNGEAANLANYLKYKQVLADTEAANPLVDSLKNTGSLPSNCITKAQAEALGWEPGKALNNYAHGKQLGGDVYQNSNNLLPNVR